MCRSPSRPETVLCDNRHGEPLPPPTGRFGETPPKSSILGRKHASFPRPLWEGQACRGLPRVQAAWAVVTGLPASAGLSREPHQGWGLCQAACWRAMVRHKLRMGLEDKDGHGGKSRRWPVPSWTSPQARVPPAAPQGWGDELGPQERGGSRKGQWSPKHPLHLRHKWGSGVTVGLKPLQCREEK